MIGRYGMKAIPQQRAQMLGQSEVAEDLAMNPPLPLGDLQRHRAQQFAVHAVRHLEIGNAPCQLLGRVMHGLPQRRQLAEVIQRRPPHPVVRRIHAAHSKIPPPQFKAQKPARCRP